MLIVEKKPVCLAVGVALQGFSASHPLSRWMRARVLFPDIGKPCLDAMGFLRYPGEFSLLKPEANHEELALPEGLTINL